MITRAQWDAMTPQQQWDQYCLLESMVNPDGDEPQSIFGIPIVYKDLSDTPEGSVILRVQTPEGWIGIQSPKRQVPEKRPRLTGK